MRRARTCYQTNTAMYNISFFLLPSVHAFSPHAEITEHHGFSYLTYKVLVGEVKCKPR